MKFLLPFILFLFFINISLTAQVKLINKKGTVMAIDTGMWKTSANNIFNKNTGNVGVGNPSPTYKLDVTGKTRISDSLVANSARIISLNSGTINDSIVVADPVTGIFKRISANRIAATASEGSKDSTTASNGLTLTGKDVRLGGALTSATSITTSATNTIAFSGLQTGTLNDSFIVADPSTGILKRVSSGRINGWGLQGNSGTDPSTNFIGTKDNVDLVFKINNTESGRLSLYQLSASFGHNALAGYKSTAIGYAATTTTNTESVAIGYNSSSVFQSVSVGADASNSGNNAIAIGQNANAGFQSSAIGASTSATGNNSTAIGFGATTSQANALILGNSSVKVGIGTSTPANALEVNASSNPLKLNGLQSGTTSDSLLTVNSSGVVRQVSMDAYPPILMLVASRTSSYSISGSYSTLNYNSASVNVGTAYNTSSGEFTAPVTGLYQVVVNNLYSAGVSNDNAVRLRIIVNGSVDMELATTQSPYTAGSTITSISGTTFVSLNSGQKISIQVGDETRTMNPQTGTGQHVLKIIRLK